MTNMALDTAEVREGLEGVLVTETRLSHVDGEEGRLIVAGFDVEQLAAQHSFEAACALLWRAAGEQTSEEEVASALAAGRALAFERLPTLGDALGREHAMDALRAAVAHLPEQATREQIVGALAVFLAAWARMRDRCPPIEPPRGVHHAEAILTMLGGAVDAARVRALDGYLVTVMDHGLNASTFAARVVASTDSDLVSSVVAGIGALKGPLHGGAPGPVLAMLDAIEEPTRARSFLERELAAGRRIMGMGHRIYRQRDPRAAVLERAIEALEVALADRGSARPHERDARARAHELAAAPASAAHDARSRARLSLARAVEREAEALLEQHHPGRKLRANVEFYTAVLLSALDVPEALFSALFAASRCAGWSAHVVEQRRRGRLIRPSARYIGELPNLSKAS
jgi:citrate synthase